ncbi:hypothetical protein RhiTH_010728 [Rhizoctonia solani]|uniref:Uncharacterized protein n=1 Tax=Rhizoctonia solani TaxID=456999 RepID=A0A8H7LFZ9_9AGAM|nr:hypothetical protein RHS04_09013 [Rhizoctonia solani]
MSSCQFFRHLVISGRQARLPLHPSLLGIPYFTALQTIDLRFFWIVQSLPVSWRNFLVESVRKSTNLSSISFNHLLFPDVKALLLASAENLALESIQLECIPVPEADVIELSTLFVRNNSLRSITVPHKLLRHSTLSLFCELPFLQVLNLTAGIGEDDESPENTLWQTYQPLTRLEFPALLHLSLDAPPEYIEGLPILADTLQELTVSSPDAFFIGSDSEQSSSDDQEAYCAALDNLVKVGPNTTHVNLRIGYFCHAFVDRLTMFNQLVTAKLFNCHPDPELMDYARERMETCMWVYGNDVHK